MTVLLIYFERRKRTYRMTTSVPYLEDWMSTICISYSIFILKHQNSVSLNPYQTVTLYGIRYDCRIGKLTYTLPIRQFFPLLNT